MNMRRIVSVAIAGNALEVYDMVIYGFFCRDDCATLLS